MNTRRITAVSAFSLALAAAYAGLPVQQAAPGVTDMAPSFGAEGMSMVLTTAQGHTTPCLIRNEDAWMLDKQVLRIAMTCGASDTPAPNYPVISEHGIQINSALLTWSSEVRNVPQSPLSASNTSAKCNGVRGNMVQDRDCGRVLDRLEVPPLSGVMQPGSRTYIF